MARTFYRKKFSNYLGEQRAIDDIVLFFTADISPTPSPTPSITPSNTPTPSITPSPTATPIISVTTTPTSTPTNTPTRTPNVTSTSTSTPTNTPTRTPQVTSTSTPTNTPTKTPQVTSTSTPTNTPTRTPNVTSTPTLTSTPTPTNTICWDSFTISGSSAPTPLPNGIYQEMITYSGGSLSSGWASGPAPFNFVNGTAPDGNDYRVFGHYDGTNYYNYLWWSNAGTENWRCVKTTGNYWVLGGTYVSNITGGATATGSTTPDGVYYYPIAQTYTGFPSYTLLRGSICPTPTPTQTPTNTKTPTPTPTPSSPPIYNTAGVVTSDICGGVVSGGTFSITFSGITYPLSTIYSDDAVSNLIPIPYPSPGIVYDFQLNNDSGYTLCNYGLGYYDRIKVTVGPSSGFLIWSSTTQFYSGATLVYQDTNDNVTLQNAPYIEYGQTYDINISVIYTSLAGFAVRGRFLANELDDIITTENDDLLEIEP